MEIAMNSEKQIKYLADGKSKQRNVKRKNNLQGHYQVILAPEEIVPFIKEKGKYLWDIQSFEYLDKDSMGYKLHFEDKIRKNQIGSDSTPVDHKTMMQLVDKFSSIEFLWSHLGKNSFEAIADVYTNLEKYKPGATNEIVRLRGKHNHYHLQLGDLYERTSEVYTRRRNLDLALNINRVDSKDLEENLIRDGKILRADFKTEYCGRFYDWEKEH